MGLIKTTRIFIITLFLFRIAASLGAQSLFLAPEIEKLERLAQTSEQRHETLLRLARLYQLSGNKEKALESWITAAYTEPGKRDDYALLEAAKLWISMGEYDRAGSDLRMIILTNQDEKIQHSALYLSAQLHVFRTGDGGPLSQFAEIPGYRGVQSRIFYTLWKITGETVWRTRLLNTFPRSPEAEIARGNTGIVAAITPQWLFFPPRENPGPPSSVQNPSAQASVSTAPVLQTGLFRSEDYANAMASRLVNAGFMPEIIRRSVDGVSYWAVIVRPGPDVNQTISDLKDAGIDSFPVR